MTMLTTVAAVVTAMVGATDDNQLKAALKETTATAAAQWFGNGYESGNGGGDSNGDGNGANDIDGNSGSDGNGNSNSGGDGNGIGDSGGGGGGGGGGCGRWTVEYTTMIVACISLKELLACDGDAFDAFGGRDGDAMKVALADYLARRLRTLILTCVRDNVAINLINIGRPCPCHGGSRGRWVEDDAGGSRLDPMTPFILKRTGCRVSSLSLGVGRMPKLEMILRASSVIASYFKSAAPATMPANDGV